MSVERVVAEAVPDRTLTAVDPVGTGNRRETAVARFADAPPLVVQWSADGGVHTEAAVRRLVRERTPIPVPATTAVGRLDGWAYLVSEYRPGRDLHTVFADMAPDRQRAIARTFGGFLGELHAAVAFDGCGELRVDSAATPSDTQPSLTAPATPRGEWLREYGQQAIERLPEAFDPLRDRLWDAVRDAAAATAGESHLYPWDLRPGNALVDDTGVTAVVDWERPLAAPAGVAVAKTRYLVAVWYVDDSGPLRRAFRRGYRGVRSLPAVHAGHRVAAIADSAVDSAGAVTRPGYPERSRERAIAFHRRALADAAGG